MEFDAFFQAAFWLAVAKIIVIDILLGGDNAIIIALACRNLPPEQQRKGIVWGTFAAIALRAVLIVFAVSLLSVSFLKLAGGALLLWIGVKLLTQDGGHGDGLKSEDTLWAAVKTIIVADVVMSFDNVIAIAGAAQSAPEGMHIPLVVFGLLVSVPIIVWGSKFVIGLIDRFPAVVVAGGGLLGWIGAGMMVTDAAVVTRFGELGQFAQYAAQAAGAAFVMGLGKFLSAGKRMPTAS